MDEVNNSERKFKNNVGIFRADYNGKVIAVLLEVYPYFNIKLKILNYKSENPILI